MTASRDRAAAGRNQNAQRAPARPRARQNLGKPGQGMAAAKTTEGPAGAAGGPAAAQ